MNRGIYRLKNISLRKIVAVFLIAFAFLAIPAFGYSELFQAQAAPLIGKVGSPILDKDTAAKVVERAEDRVGDRPIGDTGLKNIKQLGKNIPETGELVVRQRTGTDKPGTVDAKNTSERLKAASSED